MWPPTTNWGPKCFNTWDFEFRRTVMQQFPSPIPEPAIISFHRLTAPTSPWSDGPGSIHTSQIRSSRLSTPSHIFSTSRISKQWNSCVRSMTIVGLNPTISIPPGILNTEIHSALTFSLVCEIQRSMKIWHLSSNWFHLPFRLLKDSSIQILCHQPLWDFLSIGCFQHTPFLELFKVFPLLGFHLQLKDFKWVSYMHSLRHSQITFGYSSLSLSLSTLCALVKQ